MKYRLLVLLAAGTLSCNENVPAPASDEPEECETPPQGLQWKRTHAFTHDLMAALELEASELCLELDQYPCAHVHRFALGSNDPFGVQIYTRPEQPSTITPIVTDRVVLAACSQRATLDANATNAVVFTDIDLSANTLEPVSEAVRSQVQSLYRRILLREPTDEEVAIVVEPLETGGLSALEFAKTACFSIAGTTEFLFF